MKTESSQTTGSGTASNLSYPYSANEARRSQIARACTELKAGIKLEEAISVAGIPDLSRPLFEPKVIGAKQIGNTHWYFLDVDDPDKMITASLMRLSTDFDDTITKVDYWGFDPKKVTDR